MSKRLKLPQVPAWLSFCKRYAGDCARFAIEVQQLKPSMQQLQLFDAVSKSAARVSVTSGHGTGKTTSIANIVLWHLLCYPQSITLLTANDMDQVKATLFKEISLALERIRRGYHGWIAEYVEILANASARIVDFEQTWRIESKTANDKTANKMAGRHGKWLLIIADEASSLSDNVLTTLNGALTEEHNRMLLTSQPTRTSGFFYRTHHELSKNNGGNWQAMRFSSIDSPFVSTEALKDLWQSYDDEERSIRILGQFVHNSSKHLMGRKISEKLYTRGRILGDEFGYLILADIASGEGLRDKSACVIAKVWGTGDLGEFARKVEVIDIPILTNKIRANQLANFLIEAGENYPNATYVIDSGGLGVSVAQDLEDKGANVHRVNWGSPCFRKNNNARYNNLRAQAMHQAARAAKEGRLSVLTSKFKNVLIAQSSRIPKAFTEKGRLKIPQKGAKEWEGLASPDLWDAICFAFLENVNYAPSGENSTLASEQTAKITAQVASMFDNL